MTEMELFSWQKNNKKWVEVTEWLMGKEYNKNDEWIPLSATLPTQGMNSLKFRFQHKKYRGQENTAFIDDVSISGLMKPTPAPVLVPTPAPVVLPWETIFDEDFEEGSTDSFPGASIETFEGKNCLLLKRQQQKGAIKSKNYFVDFSEIKLEFSFYFDSMEEDDSFFLRMKLNGKWIRMKEWMRGEDYDNGAWYTGSVVVDTKGSKNVKLQFRGGGIRGDDKIYMDKVTLSGK